MNTEDFATDAEYDLAEKLANSFVADVITPAIEQVFEEMRGYSPEPALRALLGNLIAARLSGAMLIDSLIFDLPGVDDCVVAQFERLISLNLKMAAEVVKSDPYRWARSEHARARLAGTVAESVH